MLLTLLISLFIVTIFLAISFMFDTVTDYIPTYHYWEYQDHVFELELGCRKVIFDV